MVVFKLSVFGECGIDKPSTTGVRRSTINDEYTSKWFFLDQDIINGRNYDLVELTASGIKRGTNRTGSILVTLKSKTT